MGMCKGKARHAHVHNTGPDYENNNYSQKWHYNCRYGWGHVRDLENGTLTSQLTPRMVWISSNLFEKFKKFGQHSELVFTEALKDKNEDIKLTYFLLWIGDTGGEMYNTIKICRPY